MVSSLAVLLAAAAFQTATVDIRAELPKNAECHICTLNGAPLGKEAVAPGVMYGGKANYLCNTGEAEAFKAEPEAYMPPVLPSPMPAFDLDDLSGKKWDRKGFENRVLLVDFWATWCGPCRALKPTLDKLRKKHVAQGFEVLSVSIDDTIGELKRFLKRNKFPNPVLFDSANTSSAWKVRAIPSTFLVRDGQVVGQWVGVRKFEELDKAVSAALTKTAAH